MKKKYNFNLKEIGNRLKAVRKKLNVTIEKMHEITGFSKSLISEAENGIKKPSTIYLFELLNNFNVSADYILTGKGEMFLPEMEDEEQQPLIFADDYDELFFLVNNVDMVRYEMLSYFINYKTRNKSTINKLLEEKKKNYRV